MGLQFITYHRTAVRPAPGEPHVVTFDQFARQLELILQSGVAVAHPRVLEGAGPAECYQLGITFDDGYKSDLANAALLARHGLAAIFFVSTANIGREGYLDEGDIRQLLDMGMRIGSHSHQHKRLNTLPEDEAGEQLAHSKARLDAILGQAEDCLAFPGGGYDDAVIALARAAGFRHLFTTDWGLNVFPCGQGGLYRRNNILSSMSDKAFSDLITLRSLWRRNLQFGAKQCARALLPEKNYVALRNLVLRGSR